MARDERAGLLLSGVAVGVLVAVSIASQSCSSSSNPTGGLRQACYANGTCNAGLTCVSKVCVDLADGGSAGSGAGGAGGAAGSAGGTAGGAGAGGAAGSAGGTAGGADAGGAAGADGGAAFSPTDLSTLALWLEGDQGVALTGGNVASWANQAPNGVPLTACPSALLTTVSGAANGHAAVHFNLNCMTASDDASLHWGSDDFVLEAVVRLQANTATGVLWSKGAGGFYLVAAPGAQIAGYSLSGAGAVAATAGSPIAADGAFHLVGIRRVGSSLQVRVGGQAMATASLAGTEDGTQAGQPLYLGVLAPQYAAISGFVGDVAELVAVHGTTSDANVGKLESYFNAKYALP